MTDHNLLYNYKVIIIIIFSISSNVSDVSDSKPLRLFACIYYSEFLSWCSPANLNQLIEDISIELSTD